MSAQVARFGGNAAKLLGFVDDTATSRLGAIPMSQLAPEAVIDLGPLRARRPAPEPAMVYAHVQHQPACVAIPRRGRRTNSAASSASLSSVARRMPTCARIVKPRERSMTWLARAATGKLDGTSPALMPS